MDCMAAIMTKFLISSARQFACVCMGVMLISMFGTGGAVAATPTLSVTPTWPTAWTYRLEAKISGLSFNIQARMEWAVTQGHYQAKLRYSVPFLGHRTQTSSGLWSPQGLSPLVFTDATTRRHNELTFDWDTHEVKRDQQPFYQALKIGTQDPLSVFFEKAIKLAKLQSPSKPPENISFTVVSTRRTESWSFNFIGIETLDLPAGSYETLHWQRPASADDKGVVADIWFAPALDFLPVRIRLSQNNGDVLDQKLSTLH